MFDTWLPLSETTMDKNSQEVHRRIFLVLVDESQEMRSALHFACRRARNTGGRVALLSVAKLPEFQHWMFIGNLMQEEAREQAEQHLHQCAALVHQCSGEMPELILREGDSLNELLKLVSEDKRISVVVLGASVDSKGPGPIITALTGKQAGKLRVPLTIVPGNLTEQQIDGLT